MSEERWLRFPLVAPAEEQQIKTAKEVLSQVAGVARVEVEVGAEEVRVALTPDALGPVREPPTEPGSERQGDEALASPRREAPTQQMAQEHAPGRPGGGGGQVSILHSLLAARLEAAGVLLRGNEPEERPLVFSEPIKPPPKPLFAPSLPILGQDAPQAAPLRPGARAATRWISIPIPETGEKEAKALLTKLLALPGVIKGLVEPRLSRARLKVRFGEVSRRALLEAAWEGASAGQGRGNLAAPRTVLIVPGLTDPAVADRLAEKLSALPGVERASANPASGLAVVWGEAKEEELLGAARSLGLSASLRGGAPPARSVLPWVGAFLAALVLVSGEAGAQLTGRAFLPFEVRVGALGLAFLFTGLPWLRYPLRADAPRWLAVLGCLVGAFFLSPSFFPLELGAAVLMGEALAQSLEARLRFLGARPLFDLIQRASAKARVEESRDGNTLLREVESPSPGDMVVVRAKEIIPVDGPVIRGRAELVEHSALPRGPLRPGGFAFAGQEVSSGEVAVRALAVGHETILGGLILRAEEVRAEQPAVSRLLRAAPLLGMLLALLVGFFFWTTESGEVGLAAALSVLALVVPGALRSGANHASAAAASLAAAHGIRVGEAAAFSRGARVSQAIFDRSGALCRGEFRVTDVVPLGNVPEDTLLRYAAGAETDIPHPAAEAILDHARAEKINPPEPEMQDAEVGAGVLASVLGRAVCVGKSELLEENNISPDALDEIAQGLGQEGKELVYVAIDRKLSGLIALEDRPRPGARAALKELKTLGVTPILLSGGDHQANRALAEALDITEIRTRVLPHQRPWEPESLREEGICAAAVGDAEIDAPLLAAADVSIALNSHGDGPSWSFESAKQDPGVVAQALSLSRATERAGRASLYGALAFQAVLLMGVLSGLVPAAVAAFLAGLAGVGAAAFSLKTLEVQSAVRAGNG